MESEKNCLRVSGLIDCRTLHAIPEGELAELLKAVDRAGFGSLELWGADDFSDGLDVYRTDPWERLRTIRDGISRTSLRLTLAGQCLLGQAPYADDVAEYFVARSVENGIDTLRVYDALNDPRNIETVASAAKKRGAWFEGAMVYAVSPAHSNGFFAGYAALLEKMGADSVCVIDPERALTPDETSKLVAAVKGSCSLPISVEVHTVGCASAAATAGADEICVRISCETSGNFTDITSAVPTALSARMLGKALEYLPADVAESGATDERMKAAVEGVRADAGYPPMASPVDGIVYAQAAVGAYGDVYGELLPEFKALVRGMYGRTPMPPSPELVALTGKNAPIMLTRPADMLSPELESLRSEAAQYLEQAEDILTYAMSPSGAIGFFEYRKAREYGIDAVHSDPKLGVHVI